MQPSLSVVPSSVPEPPYSADTKANGYRPEFDLPRIQQSRTWLLADNEVRPWLLMLWLHSWGNFPCGSWEDDDELIAASIGCKPEFFVGHKRQLMRGWVRHADGRLYHPFITAQVIEMKSKRRYEADRKKRQRDANLNKQILNVPRDSHRSHGVDQDQEDLSSMSYSQDSSSLSSKNTAGQISAEDGEKFDRAKRINVPYKQIVDLYHELLPMLPKVEKLTETRKGYIRQRWQEDLLELNHWRNFFTHVSQSRFLTGKKPGRNGQPPFLATLDWLCRPNNFAKISEEYYHRG